MKIHIVRKGDTLWEIAKQYGVDFEELKKSNPQLSSPDMIMPGMKVKIPSGSKSVKKETVTPKESQVPATKEAPKQAPKIKEDDHAKPKEVKVEMPKKYMPEMPSKLQTPKQEVPTMEETHKMPAKPKKELPKVPMKEMIKMPVMEEELPKELPKVSQPQKPKKEEEFSQQISVAPIYHYYHHCCPPFFHNCFGGDALQHQHMQQWHMVPPVPLHPQQMMHPQDCGCHAVAPQMQHHQMREQMPFPGMNFEPFAHQTYLNESQMHQEFERLAHSAEKPFPVPPAYPLYSQPNAQKEAQEQQSNEER